MPTDKIATAELRGIAAGDSGESVSVLIQPSVPQRRIKVDKVTRGGVTVNVPVGVEPTSPEEDDLAKQRVTEVGSFLETVLGTAPHWLPSARSFVARVTPEQLRTIADSSMIEAIWPNRELRTPNAAVIA